MKLWSLLFVLSFSGQAFAKEDIVHFLKVTDGVYRSGRVSERGDEILKSQYGVKTIINIEDDEEFVFQEQRKARELGIEFIWSPMDTGIVPNDKEVDRLLAIMNDPEKQPVLIHCKHGEDRTGLMVGLFRVLVQKWRPEVAYQEMRDLGFKFFYLKYKKYFRYRTGWEVAPEESGKSPASETNFQ
jgi:tyrosine-protein phosphatase SIW14